MVVRELIALLRFKTDPKSVKKTESSMTKLIGYAKAAAAAFASFKLAQWAKDAAEQTAILGDSLSKMAIRTDASVKALQELGFAAEVSGADIGAIEGAITSLRSAQFSAMMGSAEHAKAFGMLGVSIKDASGKMRNASDLIPDVADALNRFSDSTWKASLANKVFGGSGTALLPMLSSGSAGIRSMMQEARTLGGVIDSRLIRSSERFVENQKRMAGVLQGVKNAIARALLPFMIKAQDAFVKWIKVNGDWLRTKITDAFTRFARVIENVGMFLRDTVKWLSDLWRDASRARKGVLAITAALIGLGAALSLPFAPFFAFAALLALLIEDFQVWRRGGKSAIGLLINGFKDFSKEVEKSTGIDIFGGLLKSAKFYLKTLKLVKETLLAIGELIWNVFAVGPKKAFKEFGKTISEAFGEVVDSLELDKTDKKIKGTSDKTKKAVKETNEETKKISKETKKIVENAAIETALDIASMLPIPGIGLGVGAARLIRRAMKEKEGPGVVEKVKGLLGAEEKPQKKAVPRGVAAPTLPALPIQKPAAPIAPEVPRGAEPSMTVIPMQSQTDATVKPMMGIGPAPVMTAPVNNITMSYSPNVNVNVDISGTEPVSAEQIKSDIETVVRRQLDEQNSTTMDLLIPAAAGAR